MTEVKILDKEAALAQMGGDREIYNDVAAAFLTDAPRRIVEIQEAFGQNDSEAVSRNAHSLKSSSRTVGGMRLGMAAQALEKRSGADTFDDLTILIEEVLVEFNVLKDTLNKEGIK
jgi:HPt (histidine-containing phosphotransfer) domain-containing protein